jgi:hypothetical protein
MAAHVDISLSAFRRCLEHEHLVALRLWPWANRNARAAALNMCLRGCPRRLRPRHPPLNTAPKASLVINHIKAYYHSTLLARQMWRSCTVSWTLCILVLAMSIPNLHALRMRCGLWWQSEAVSLARWSMDRPVQDYAFMHPTLVSVCPCSSQSAVQSSPSWSRCVEELAPINA